MSIVKSISVGEGDMFYIKHNSSNFSIIDCCMDDTTQESIVAEIIDEKSEKKITRFISTHPHDDHIMGLKYLDEKIEILNFYCVKNEATKPQKDITEDFIRYCDLRDSEKKSFYLYEGCSRKWMNQSSDENGSSGINILWPVLENEEYKNALAVAKSGGNPNNISPIIKYSIEDGPVFLWFGDLENSFTEKIKDAIKLPQADIIFAPHHGRDSGSLPSKWMDQIKPKVVIIGEAPAKDINYLAGYNTITQNSAGNIVFDCNSDSVDIYVSNKNYSVSFLSNEKKSNAHSCYYLGTLKLK